VNTSQRYEWLVPVGSYGQAHAFVIRERLSVCVHHERWPMGEVGWEREQRLSREPQRARCLRCQELLAHPGNSALTEDP